MIATFIRELGDYERLLHEVVVTEEQLRRELFGERPAAEVLIGTLDGEDVGFALFFHNFSTFLGRRGIYLEDLYVRPQARGRGVGRLLLARVARLAVDRGCGRLEWSVLDWNTPAIDFYRRMGARPMDEWTVHRVTGPALDALARETTM
jgi:GNAT superfamily N-acetyltransferase